MMIVCHKWRFISQLSVVEHRHHSMAKSKMQTSQCTPQCRDRMYAKRRSHESYRTFRPYSVAGGCHGHIHLRSRALNTSKVQGKSDIIKNFLIATAYRLYVHRSQSPIGSPGYSFPFLPLSIPSISRIKPIHKLTFKSSIVLYVQASNILQASPPWAQIENVESNRIESQRKGHQWYIIHAACAAINQCRRRLMALDIKFALRTPLRIFCNGSDISRCLVNIVVVG